MAHIRAGPEQKDSTPVSELKKIILLNNLIPTSTLEGERLLGELCKVWRAWGQGSNVGRWQELSKWPLLSFSLKLIFQGQCICHIEEKQFSSCLPRGALCIPCNTAAAMPFHCLPPCIAVQWPMPSHTSFATCIFRDLQWSWMLTSTENTSAINWSSQISQQMSYLSNRSKTWSSNLLCHILVLQTVRNWVARKVKAGLGMAQMQAG